MFATFRTALVLLLLLTIVTGVLYPLAITAIAQTIFPHAANGSLITRDGKTVGSELIGQEFTEARYFSGRPSATGPVPYNAAASTGSNYGPTNAAQQDAVKARLERWHTDVPANKDVPIELVTASASGLDPHLSPAAALFQAERVAAARQLSVEQVRTLVQEHIESRTFGVLGEPRVNVLRLNLALDQLRH
jgi:K+-transporting ATPase ATPase C chain